VISHPEQHYKQFLTIPKPPYVLGCLCTVVGGYYSDKTGKRAM
jgi:hypothetical protein